MYLSFFRRSTTENNLICEMRHFHQGGIPVETQAVSAKTRALVPILSGSEIMAHESQMWPLPIASTKPGFGFKAPNAGGFLCIALFVRPTSRLAAGQSPFFHLRGEIPCLRHSPCEMYYAHILPRERLIGFHLSLFSEGDNVRNGIFTE